MGISGRPVVRAIVEDEKKIRVGIFQWYVPHYRERFFLLLSKTGGFDITVCSPFEYEGHFLKTAAHSSDFNHQEIKSWRFKIPFTHNYITFQPFSVIAALKRKFDVIVLANDILGLDVWFNVLIKHICRTKVCLWGQGISRPETKLRASVRKQLMSMADCSIFYTEEARQLWIKRGVAPHKLFVAPNSLDTLTSDGIRANITDELLQEFRKGKGLTGRQPLLYCSRLQKRKKPALLVRAMVDVLKVVPSACLVFIGDGPERQNLENLVAELNLKADVKFTGSLYDEEEIAKYFLISRVSVMPAAAGLTIQHSFGYGIPIIIGDSKSSHGPEAYLVRDKETGLIFNDDDAGCLAKTIVMLITDDGLRKKLSHNAYDIIHREHNILQMVNGMARALSLVGGRG